MKTFDTLLDIMDKLMGPNGCPWDREQTFQSLRTTVLEEACEVIDAIDEDQPHKILEEVGDLLLNVVFFCKLGEKHNYFTTNNVIEELNEKLVRRHPHVFGDVKIEHSEHVVHQWEQIKKEEKGNQDRKSALDGIPKGLPALARALKALKKMKKADYLPECHLDSPEEQHGKKLLELVIEGQVQGFDSEQALRKVLSKIEKEFREWEQQS